MEPSSVAVVNQIAKVSLSQITSLSPVLSSEAGSVFWVSLTDLTGIPARHTGDTQIAVTATTTTKTIHCEYESPVADPGERPGGAGSPPYFWTKLRPEGPKKFWGGDCPPAPQSQGMDPALISSTEIQSQGPPKLFLLSLSRTWITVK